MSVQFSIINFKYYSSLLCCTLDFVTLSVPNSSFTLNYSESDFIVEDDFTANITEL
jgi:hypothetical protein